ncbi:hypothetical protein AGDE_15709 [Angomonas deanei]|nr:hypothetical protein AGDE_15709 [Angomonas deanei]|eukprot:EPY18605.1 hypothetical protein AGDE_15709 [Angomonas deanei]
MTHEPFPFPSDILPFREEPPHRWGSDYNYGDRPSYAYGYDDRDRYRPSDYVPRASYPYPTPVSHADPYSPYPVSRLTEEPKTFYYTLPKSVPPSGDDGARLMEADEAFQVGEIQGTSLPGYFEGGIDQAEYKWYDEHNVAEVPYSTVNEDLYSPWKAENTGLQRDEVEGRGELPAATVESFPYNTPGYLNTADTADPEYYIFEEDTYADPLYTQHAARGDPSLPYSYYTPSYSASLPQRDTYLANNLDQW